MSQSQGEQGYTLRGARERLHAIRDELDELIAWAGDAEKDDPAWGPPWELAFYLRRAQVAVTTADKAAAKGTDPRELDPLPALKRVQRRRRRRDRGA